MQERGTRASVEPKALIEIGTARFAVHALRSMFRESAYQSREYNIFNYHSFWEARRAPSARLSNFAHITVG
jgi:hypothetical protein